MIGGGVVQWVARRTSVQRVWVQFPFAWGGLSFPAVILTPKIISLWQKRQSESVLIQLKNS